MLGKCKIIEAEGHVQVNGLHTSLPELQAVVDAVVNKRKAPWILCHTPQQEFLTSGDTVWGSYSLPSDYMKPKYTEHNDRLYARPEFRDMGAKRVYQIHCDAAAEAAVEIDAGWMKTNSGERRLRDNFTKTTPFGQGYNQGLSTQPRTRTLYPMLHTQTPTNPNHLPCHLRSFLACRHRKCDRDETSAEF